MNHVINYVTWAALSHPHVAFKLIHNGNSLIEARQCNNIMERIHILYGRDFAENIVEFQRDFETIKLHAFVSKPGFTRSNRDQQIFFLNRRPIRSRLLGGAMNGAFQSILPKGRYPVAILFLEIEPSFVDVNVHPAKTEVRFRDEGKVYNEVLQGLLLAMKQQEYIPEIRAPIAEQKDNPVITTESSSHPREAKVQSSVLEYLKKQGNRPDIIPNYPSTFPKRMDTTPKLPFKQAQTESMALPFMDFDDIQVKTRLFNTYIVAEIGDELLFIDQHIAEEKILYEKFKEQVEKQNVASQGLLLPVTVEMSPAQLTMLDSAIEIMAKMGFVMEAFGGRTVVIRSVPFVLQKGDVKKIVMDLLDQITTSQDKNKIKLQDDALIMTACHSAIQAGDTLTDAESMNLIKELFKTSPPYLCPHGRPIVVRMKRSELEIKFQRK